MNSHAFPGLASSTVTPVKYRSQASRSGTPSFRTGQPQRSCPPISPMPIAAQKSQALVSLGVQSTTLPCSSQPSSQRGLPIWSCPQPSGSVPAVHSLGGTGAGHVPGCFVGPGPGIGVELGGGGIVCGGVGQSGRRTQSLPGGLWEQPQVSPGLQILEQSGGTSAGGPTSGVGVGLGAGPDPQPESIQTAVRTNVC
jgi:hypothetical protein